MKNYLIAVLIIIPLLFGCQSTESKGDLEQWKAEIVAVEKAFNDMAAEEGIDKAFEYYAAESGVIMRNNKIIQGKSAIADFSKSTLGPGQTLTWAPTFIDVSSSGDMAYTYGDFTFTYPDSLGVNQEAKGIFHTVWKRQDDGSWKYVWD